MPAKGPYSNLIQPNEFVAPLDLNLYAQSMQYREGLAKQNLQDISNLYNSAFNIPTYGKDKEKLIEIENGLKSQLQSLNLSNLGNAETASQIRNLISQTVNSKDLQGIAERYYTYANEEKLAKDALEKGKTYISPIKDQAEEYYSSGVYKTDKRFSGSGFYDPNLTAAKNEILKNAPKIKKNVKQGNYFVSLESPDMDWVVSQMQDLYSKPEVQKFMQYQFDRNHKNTDWVSVGMQTLQDRLQKAQAALQIDPTDVKAQQFIDSYPSLANNPERLAQIAKNERFNSEFQKALEEDILAANYESFGQMDADDFALKAVDHQYRQLEEQFNSILPGAQQYGLTGQEINTILANGRINKNGNEITIDNLADATVTQQASATYQKSLKQAEAKAQVKQQTLGQLGDSKIPSTQAIIIGNTNYTKGEWDDIVGKMKSKTPKWTENDKSALLDVIKTYPEYFGLPDDYSSLAGTDVKINKDGTIEIVNPWYRRNTPAADLSRLATAVNDAALKRSSNSPQNSNNTSYNKQILKQEGYSDELIQKAIDALVAANADTTDANIRHVIKQNQ